MCLPAVSDSAPAIDAIAFLWAGLALFDDEPAADTGNIYRPRPLELYDVAEARDRILRRLMEAPEGGSLNRFLPDPPEEVDSMAVSRVRRHAAWSSTLVACLELAKGGALVLAQEGAFQTIQVVQR